MPSAEPRRASDARSGCGMSPTTLRCSLQTPAMSSRLPFGLRTYRSTMRSSSRRRPASLVAHVVALEVVDQGRSAPGLGQRGHGRATRLDPAVNRLAEEGQPAFFWSAPGAPASVSTWKPLQMPTTGPPAAANRATASITGERAIAPVRR